MKTYQRGNERGIALITALIFLIMLSAMAAGLIYMASTETQINYNFRGEQTAYFAAKAGIEEMRDRMMTTNANTIAASLPTGVPTTTSNVVYLLNEGNKAGTVLPWQAGNQYMDTELCHDGYTNLSLSLLSTDIPCASVPTGSYTKVYSVLPFANTSAAIPFKWVRLTLKQGSTVQNYPVSGASSTSLVCWNGTYEQLLTAATCQQQTQASNPVYLLTALAVTSTGARKMVQAEVAMQPTSSYKYGLFATGTGCGAVTIGGNSTTDSYSSANGPYSSSNSSQTGGSVGSNGNVLVNGGAWIGGSVGSPITPSLMGSCPNYPLTVNGGSGGIVSNPSNTIQAISSVTVPTPTIPSTTGPNKSNPSTLSPGNYGDITLTSKTNLTLSSGVYNINSISESGQATITITGSVTLNIQGNNQTTPVDLTGGGFINSTGVPSNFMINYAGSGTIKVTGGNSADVQIYAPNSTVNLAGNSQYYGEVLANQINLGGGAAFHYDTAGSSPIVLPSYYSLLSYRELFY